MCAGLRAVRKCDLRDAHLVSLWRKCARREFATRGALTCMPKEALVLARCAPTQVSVPVEVQPLASRTRWPATFARQRIGPRTFFGSRCRTQGGVMAVYRGKHCRETDLARHNGGDDEVTS